MTRVLWFAAVVVGLAACACSADSGSTRPVAQQSARLQIVSEGGAVMWETTIAEGNRFDVSYIHSSERCVWTHHYAAGPARTITQTGSTFPCYGAGMPIGGEVTRSKMGFTMAAPRALESIDMLNSNGAAIALQYRGRSIPLRQWFNDYDAFSVRIR